VAVVRATPLLQISRVEISSSKRSCSLSTSLARLSPVSAMCLMRARFSDAKAISVALK